MRPPFVKPEWIEVDGLVFYGKPRLSRRLLEPGPDGRPVYQTADDLQSYREMLKVDQDWKLESFHNHSHFSSRDGDEACVRAQYRDAEETAAILRERFPSRRFVIVVDPAGTNSVYQASEGAPTEDDTDWAPNGPLSLVVLHEMLKAPGADPVQVRAEAFEAFRELPCERCKERWSYEVDNLRDDLPGTRWADCPQCGHPNLVAMRTTRRVVGPDPA